MKKIFTIVAIAVLAVASCTKEKPGENENNIPGSKEVTPPAEGFSWYDFQADAPTKTALDDEGVIWSAGDRIKVIYGEEDTDFAISEEGVLDAGALSASFRVALPTTLAEDATVYAVYPSDVEASLSESILSVTIPNEQTPRFGSADIIAASSTVSSLSLAFKQVCGLISFEISSGNPKSISRAQLKDLFEVSLSGKLALTFDAAGAVSFEGTSDTHSTITLTEVSAGKNHIAVLPGAALQSIGLKLGTADSWLTPLCSDTDYTSTAGKCKPLGTVDTKVGDAYYVKSGATGKGTSWADAAGVSLFEKLMSTPGEGKADTYQRRAACYQLDQQEIRVAAGTYEIPETSGYDGLFSQLEIEGFNQRATYTIKGGYDASGNADASAKATFTGNNDHRIFWIEDHAIVNFENIVFSGGKPSDAEDTEGGALKLRWVDANFTNCEFNGNDAAFGAAFFFNNGSGECSVSDCAFSNNSGGRSVIELVNVKQMSGSGSAFQDNSASWGSGSIINLRSNVTADFAGCAFSGSNKSVFRILSESGQLTLNGCRFIDNKTSYRGSSILHGGTIPVFMNNCYFEEHDYTDGFGRGLCISMERESSGGAGKLGMNNCTIYDTNSVDESGKGVVYFRGKSIISNSTIIGSGSPAVVTYGSSDSWGNSNGSVCINNIIAQTSPNWGAPRFEDSSNGYKVDVSYLIHYNFGGDEGSCATISNDQDIRQAWSAFSPSLNSTDYVIDYTLPSGYSYNRASLETVANAIKSQTDFGQEFYDWLVSVNGLSKDAAGNPRTDANNRQGALVEL